MPIPLYQHVAQDLVQKVTPGVFRLAACCRAQSLSTLDDLVSFAKSATRAVNASREIVSDIDTARALGCQPGSRWLHIAMTRSEPGAAIPLAWTDAYVDPHYSGVRLLAKKHPDRLLCDLIEMNYGRRIANMEQTVGARALGGDHAKRLSVPEGTPGLEINRKYRDAANALVLVTRSYVPADRYVISTTLVRTS